MALKLPTTVKQNKGLPMSNYNISEDEVQKFCDRLSCNTLIELKHLSCTQLYSSSLEFVLSNGLTSEEAAANNSLASLHGLMGSRFGGEAAKFFNAVVVGEWNTSNKTKRFDIMVDYLDFAVRKTETK